MNSQFPMSFGPDEIRNNDKNIKSNVVPLSLPQNSILAGSSRATSKNAKSRFDYAMSQFVEATDNFRSSRVGPGRWLMRGFLLTILGSLWFAIGTGRLTSDSPEVETIRTILSLSDSTKATSKSTSDEPALQSQMGSNESSQSTVTNDLVQASPTQGLAQEQAQTSPVNAVASANVVAAKPELSSASDSSTANSSSKVAPVPAAENSVADSDLFKAAKILSRQQLQLNEMEGHLGLLLTSSEDPGKAEKHLADLESRHLEAAAKLKQLRSKIRQ